MNPRAYFATPFTLGAAFGGAFAAGVFAGALEGTPFARGFLAWEGLLAMEGALEEVMDAFEEPSLGGLRKGDVSVLFF